MAFFRFPDVVHNFLTIRHSFILQISILPVRKNPLYLIHFLSHPATQLHGSSTLQLNRILPHPETQFHGSQTVNFHYMPIRTPDAFQLHILCYQYINQCKLFSSYKDPTVEGFSSATENGNKDTQNIFTSPRSLHLHTSTSAYKQGYVKQWLNI